MRGASLSMSLLLLATCAYVACSPPSIGEYPDTAVELPERREDGGSGSGGGSAAGGDAAPPSQTFKLTVNIAGTGAGAVMSTPSGVTCQDKTCTGTFLAKTIVGVVPAPAAGSTFTSWGGACSGNDVCTPVMNADVTVTATMDSGALAGTYTGTYTNTRQANGCTFNNAGNLTITVTAEGAGFTNTGSITGLQLRQAPPSCAISLPAATGTSPKEAVILAGATTTGTWTFNVVRGAQNLGTLALPYTGTLAGDTLSGSWTCPTCTGSFTLTRQP